LPPFIDATTPAVLGIESYFGNMMSPWKNSRPGLEDSGDDLSKAVKKNNSKNDILKNNNTNTLTEVNWWTELNSA
jgi:hypothetical protein